MSLEAIQFLAQAEEKARQMKSAAAAEAKERVADAHLRGEAMLDEAVKRAERELAELDECADSEARKNARELAEKNEANKAAMRTAARERMDEAISFIVERIVKS